MDRSARIALLIAVLGLAGASAVPAQESSHLLDGRRFVGLNGEKGRELDPHEREEIVFEDGQFRSVSCDPYGFGSAPYSAQVVADTIRFEAVTHSPTHGTISWRGQVRGERAEMTFEWVKKRWYWDTRREYWFNGTETR